MQQPLIDLHVHTISSGHAFSTLKENVEEAKAKGLKVLGISDHARTMGGTAHSYYFDNMKVINEKIMGVKVLKGIEANILDTRGTIDVGTDLAQKLDYLIASLHLPCLKSGTSASNTAALVKAMDNPYVKIIGHPDDSRFLVDYEQVVQKAAAQKVVLEMNNSSLRPQSTRQNARKNQITYLQLCMQYQVRIILGSDAHIYYDVGAFHECLQLLKELDFPEKLVVNYDLDSLKYVLI
jgi:putative hydrolase